MRKADDWGVERSTRVAMAHQRHMARSNSL
jgi:hypothetical protein